MHVSSPSHEGEEICTRNMIEFSCFKDEMSTSDVLDVLDKQGRPKA